MGHEVDALVAASAGLRLGEELTEYLRDEGERKVYDQPAAFTAFVRGGGNVELYERLSDVLAAGYDATKPDALLDVGCGDGLAVVPALDRAQHAPLRVDLVEPSEALLKDAKKGVPGAQAWQLTAQEFFARDDEQRWDAAQATFSLQSVVPEDRPSVLKAFRERATRLTIAEFDVPVYVEGTPEHLVSMVKRYERGITEYGADASLVAQGFLLPVLLGQITPSVARTNWEQPAAKWVEQLEAAGFTDVSVEPLVDYWWAPAVVIKAA
ncbi:methyltransferase [Amycolatopsis sp. cg5]|uniref:methyltransferase n=1 Tax=Amycolatopsis sp. cg5 TaxID=3238802 RepID=UPI003525BF88